MEEVTKTAGIIVVCICQWLFLGVASLAADDCEVIAAVYYERVQGEIVTDSKGEYPYRRYRTVAYPCADVTVRDNLGSLLPKVVDITAIFRDGSRASKIGWCDRKSGENEVVYSCIVCFESDLPVSSVTCSFR